MIEIDIPKDIRQYDSKLVGPFTTRQTICVVIGAVACFGVYKLTNGMHLGSDIRLFICGLPFVLSGLFGWFKPYGMVLEKFIKIAVIPTYLGKKRRLYQTNNVYAEKRIELTKKQKEEKIKSMPKSANYPKYK